MATFSTLDELLQKLAVLKGQLQEHWPVQSLALFGSWVRHEADAGSDVDLLIEFRAGEDGHIGMFEFLNIQNNLQEALGCKVDLVERAALRPRLAKTILPEAIEL